MKKNQPSPKKIGDLLVEKGYITSLQLQEALGLQKKTGEKIGMLALRLGWVSEEDIIELLQPQWSIPLADKKTLQSVSSQMKKNQPSHKKIGDLLLEKGCITPLQLQEALGLQKKTGEKIGMLALRLGWISEEDLIELLQSQWGIPLADKKTLQSVSTSIIPLIPEHLARLYQAIPLAKEGDKLIIAMVDPLDMGAIDDLSRISGLNVEPAIAKEKAIGEALNTYYPKEIENMEDLTGLNLELEEEIHDEREDIDESQLRIQADDAPVVKLVNLILAQAIRDHASDIHIEPQEKGLIVRYRIDGILFNLISPPPSVRLPLTSRLKILSGMDIAERRLPQDGSFTIKVNNKRIDLRVSTLPVIYGEKLVLRILDRDAFASKLKLDVLGLDTESSKILERYVHRPWGMILLTGPTGSGKSTTLYTILNMIKSPTKNLVTVEDPVEYRLAGIQQVEARPDIGLSFANTLRHILRQDPDIILVGEIRDLETAQMSIRSSLTGHLVFSTLHTNDSVGTILRLTNIGIEPFLVTSCLSLSIAQRLVRKVCPYCKEEYSPTQEVLKEFGFEGKELILFRGVGCEDCRYTGYLGRTAIFEMFEITPEIKRLVLEGHPIDFLKKKALDAGMVSLRQAGFKKAIRGITTIEEVLSTCIED
ncbi:MAG: ATPase, T2SS/T4P/T4SS family [Thermodesulfobacteriota bacterium]|nr:ATPase, T2SS/T4P/T4SS family [Thermodesulfobacteriota bacterium]